MVHMNMIDVDDGFSVITIYHMISFQIAATHKYVH